jgi:hypothetical protein
MVPYSEWNRDVDVIQCCDSVIDSRMMASLIVCRLEVVWMTA